MLTFCRFGIILRFLKNITSSRFVIVIQRTDLLLHQTALELQMLWLVWFFLILNCCDIHCSIFLIAFFTHINGYYFCLSLDMQWVFPRFCYFTMSNNGDCITRGSTQQECMSNCALFFVPLDAEETTVCCYLTKNSYQI